MRAGDVRLEVLTDLEREEARLLSWGVVDAAFSDEEALDLIEGSLKRHGSELDPEDVFDDLADRQLLIEARDVAPNNYRTRMAETVRLMARTRQWFHGRPWTTAAPLVADFRFDLRPRSVPRRDVDAGLVLERLAPQGPRIDQALRRLLRVGQTDERSVASFQLETTERVLRGLRRSHTGGTIVTATTGGGKTLAFYLPALAWLADVAGTPATRVLALYPRNELLKDQLVQALRELKVLRGVSGRQLRIGAYFGPTPWSARQVEQPGFGRRPWREHSDGGRVCPYLVCPDCGGPVIWPDDDRKRDVETVRCTTPGCGWHTLPDEVALTRSSMHRRPPDLLFVSTEMLNRLSSNTAARHVVGIGAQVRPSLILLDEVHTYGGTSGAHVALLLRRWRAAVGGRVQFVGLSATLRDAAGFFSTLTGLREDQVREIAPLERDLDSIGQQYQLVLRGNPMSATALLSTTIQTLMVGSRMLDRDGSTAKSGGLTGSRVFAFTDKLDIANRLFHALSDAEGWRSYGRPSNDPPLASLRAPGAFHDPADLRLARVAGQVWDTPEGLNHKVATERIGIGITTSQQSGVEDKEVIVATASLEVGYNDDRVGMVLQHKAPRDPAAFLQRRGRAGRRIEQRPWTVVVLSDFGRDGLAYRAYDRLFDPNLPARSLPISNQAVLRMQAAYATLDWLAGRIRGRGSVWDDLTRPGRPRQPTLADLIEQTLTTPDLLASLRGHLISALGVEPGTADRLLWAPPRPIITGLLPTALRRLRTGWGHHSRKDGDLRAQTSPLPDYMPVNLFTDLQMPEVMVEVPPQNRNAEVGRHELPIYTAMTEFAPGNVSFRFAVEGAWAASWIAPNEAGRVELSDVLSAWDELDEVSVEGARHRFLRPWGMLTERRPSDVRDTSSGRLRWSGGPQARDVGVDLELPQDSGWHELLGRSDVHTHANHGQVVARRYATGYDASLAYKDGGRDEVGGTFSVDGEAAVLGFEYDADAMRFVVKVPSESLVPPSTAAEAHRSFRAAWFSHVLGSDARLQSATNVFQREQLERAYVAALVDAANRDGVGVADAHAAIEPVLEDILPRAIDALFGVTDVDQAEQRGLKWLRDAAANAAVRHALSDAAARALVRPLDSDAEDWARERVVSTVAASLREAVEALCPEFDAEADLVLDIVPREPGQYEVWFVETSPGGGGVIEVVQRRATERPRRFLALADRALGPSDFEVVDGSLAAILDVLAQGLEPLSGAVGGFRAARTNAARAQSLQGIREALVAHDIPAPHSVIAALAARVLRPGADSNTDAAMAYAVQRWEELERRLGVELESSAVAYALRKDPQIDPLAAGFGPASDEGRIAGALGALWLRGWRARAQSLSSASPYGQPPPTDRLLLRRYLRSTVPEVRLSSDGWPDAAHHALANTGGVRLISTSAEALADALRRLTAEPTDTGALLLHAVVTELGRDGNEWAASAVLGESALL